MIGVTLKLDPLLEVDQVKLHFIRAAPEGEIAHDDMEESRFTRTRFPGNEGMLTGALPEGEVLQLRRTAAPDRDTQFPRGTERPPFALCRSNKRKGHLNAIRITIRRPKLMDPANKNLSRGCRAQRQCCRLHWILRDGKTTLARAQAEARLAKIVHLKTLR